VAVDERQLERPDCTAINTGNLGELLVSKELAVRGWSVCLPIFNGNVSRFDVIAAKNQQLHRIQVKASGQRNAVHNFTTGHGLRSKVRYDIGDFDFMVLVAVPVEDFFILPVDVATQHVGIKVAVGGKYWQYRNRWDLIEE